MTAASSGACRPISTSSRAIGCTPASARESTVAPTLAPHPPQRIAMAEIACACSASASGTRVVPAAASASESARFAGIGSNSLYLRMKRRSIQSFQRQTHSPRTQSAPREATAYRSPVLISASQRGWGR